jgi:hypothetical protein
MPQQSNHALKEQHTFHAGHTGWPTLGLPLTLMTVITAIKHQTAKLKQSSYSFTVLDHKNIKLLINSAFVGLAIIVILCCI